MSDDKASLEQVVAEYLREDSFMGVRGDLSLVIQDLGLKNRVPVLIQSLREKEPDENNHVIRKTIQALFKLTGKCYGFPEDFFRAVRYDWKREKTIMQAWFEKPAEEKEKALAEWEKEFGTYDRRPALLAQMRHADPANVACVACTGFGNGLFLVDDQGRAVRRGIGSADSRGRSGPSTTLAARLLPSTKPMAK